MRIERKKEVIIALDFPGSDEVWRFLGAFEALEEKPYVKIGMELFYAEGPAIVREIKEAGYKLFLDLKLHDIPNTVERAMEQLGALGVDMTNVHAAGTIPMMEAAKAGLLRGAEEAGHPEPLLLAVTQLTSTEEARMAEELWIREPMEEVILHYGENAKKAGLDGVVCSPLEARGIHEKLGEGFLTVTPGVRFAGTDVQDQARVTTPEQAGVMGADFLVMGRPITRAEDPLGAYKEATIAFARGALQRGEKE